MSLSFRVVIPARFASSRLPGKPLAEIAGRPMIAHVCEVAKRAGAVEVIVATDDERICEAASAAGVRAIITATTHLTGTDRIAEVARAAGWADDDIVVNLQGDEPLVPPSVLSHLASRLADFPRAALATAAVAIESPEELFSPHVVKAVLDREGFALYFSRAPVPWFRSSFQPLEVPHTCPTEPRPLRHLGLYAYRARTLHTLASTAATPLELAESLEQLRALESGLRIHVSVLDEAPPAGVDTPEDLERVAALLMQRDPTV